METFYAALGGSERFFQYPNYALYVDPKNTANLHQLDDIDSSFPAFIFSNEGLRTTKLFGQLRLGKTRGLSRCNKALAEHLVNG